MDKVLVVKAIEPNFNTMGGPPVMMVGGGGRSRDGPAVGRTKREVAGGVAGGLVGVAGALAGQHRSLGSLAQAMISGGAQGKALGGGLGRTFVGRTGQARANQREASRQQRAEDRAGDAEQLRNRGQGIGSRFNPAARLRRHNYDTNQREDRNADLVAIRNQGNDAGQRDLREEYSRQGNEKRRINQSRSEAEARAAGAEHGTNMKEGYERYDKLREQGIAGTSKTAQQFDSAIDELNARKPMQEGEVRVDPPQGSDMTAVTSSPRQLGGGENRQLEMTAVTPSPPMQAKNVSPAPDLNQLTAVRDAPSAPNLDDLHQENLLNDMNGKVAVTDAGGKELGDAQQMAPMASQIPQPPEGAGEENKKVIEMGTQFNTARTNAELNGEEPTPNQNIRPQAGPAGPAGQAGPVSPTGTPSLREIQELQRQLEEPPSYNALTPPNEE
tara:strand:- start:14426 stop:15751 length:1326 start_codon:yes stop_codon:yes gene_type:complete